MCAKAVSAFNLHLIKGWLCLLQVKFVPRLEKMVFTLGLLVLSLGLLVLTLGVIVSILSDMGLMPYQDHLEWFTHFEKNVAIALTSLCTKCQVDWQFELQQLLRNHKMMALLLQWLHSQAKRNTYSLFLTRQVAFFLNLHRKDGHDSR